MKLVVDASVVVKLLVEEEESEVANQLLGRAFELHAPRLMVSEVANALWRKAKVGDIERGAAGALAASVAQMPVRWTNDEDVCGDAARLAVGFGLPVYDFMYLALAHRLGARVVTADIRFVNALAGTEHSAALLTLSALSDEMPAG